MGDLDDILVADLGGVLVVDDEIALAVVVAGLGDEAHGDALGQQVVDGVDGVEAVVADDRGLGAVGGDPGGAALHRVGVDGLTFEHAGLGDGVQSKPRSSGKLVTDSLNRPVQFFTILPL